MTIWRVEWFLNVKMAFCFKVSNLFSVYTYIYVMNFSGGNKQILISIVITMIAIIGFYLFKYIYVLPRIAVDDLLSLFFVGIVYFLYFTAYWVSILLLNTILMYFFRKIKYDLLSLSFASSYLLIVLSAFTIGFIELNFFDVMLERIIE